MAIILAREVLNLRNAELPATILTLYIIHVFKNIYDEQTVAAGLG